MKPFAVLLALAAACQAAAADAPFTSTAKNNVFLADTGIVTVHAPSSSVSSGTVNVTDEHGAIVETLRIAAGSTALDVPLPHKGYYKIDVDLVGDGGAKSSQTTTAAVIGAPIPDAARLSSPFGLEAVAGDRSMVAAAGGGFDRGFTPQNGINKDGDRVAWWPGYHEKGPDPTTINYVSAVMSPPGWVVAPENRARQSINTTYPPADYESYRKVVKLFATSQTWVKYFEALNEPDAYHWKGTDAELVQYHRAIRNGLIDAGRRQKLLGPCFWSIDIQHLDKLVKLGLLDAVDGVSVHSYANAPPEGKWIEGFGDLRRYLVSVGKSNEPIYLTEYGWDIGNGDKVTPEKELQQARYASRGIALLAREHLAAAIYFALRWTDGVTGPNWSVLRPDNTPRPGYAAIANTYRWLTGCTGGTLLHPTPSSYLVLYAKAGKTIGVAWDTDAESRFQLPGKPTRVEGMTGEPVSPDATEHVTLSQSPLYFEVADPSLAAPGIGKALRFVRGQSAAMPPGWSTTALPGPLARSGQAVTAAADAQPGDYVALAKTSIGWQSVPVRVDPLWSITSARVVWPRGDADPTVAVTIHTLAATATVKPLLRLSGRPDEFGAPVTVTSKRDVDALIPVRGYAAGSPISGDAVLEGRLAGRLDTASLAFRAQPVPCNVTDSEHVDWDAVPAVSSALWRGFTGAGNAAIAPGDCSAQVRAVATSSALNLRVDVRDDVWYSGEAGAPLWATDSVQVAFDATVPGSRDRREVEYAVAGRDGKGLVARDRSTVAALSADTPEPRIAADVSRVGDMTRYDISFPWPTLGLAARPKPTDRLAFDIAINDSDGKGTARHGLEMTDGIVATKDTAGFATLLWR